MSFSITNPVVLIAIIVVCVGIVIYVLLRKPHFTRPQEKSIDDLLGKEAIVTVVIDEDANSGMVELNQQAWAARPLYTDDVIPEGTKVAVVGAEGARLVVKKIEEEN